MIKFKTDTLLGLGLSEENVKRLKDGQPIKFPVTDVGGIDGVEQIAIFYGKDEDELQEMLRPFVEITKDTKITRGKPGETF